MFVPESCFNAIKLRNLQGLAVLKGLPVLCPSVELTVLLFTKALARWGELTLYYTLPQEFSKPNRQQHEVLFLVKSMEPSVPKFEWKSAGDLSLTLDEKGLSLSKRSIADNPYLLVPESCFNAIKLRNLQGLAVLKGLPVLCPSVELTVLLFTKALARWGELTLYYTLPQEFSKPNRQQHEVLFLVKSMEPSVPKFEWKSAGDLSLTLDEKGSSLSKRGIADNPYLFVPESCFNAIKLRNLQGLAVLEGLPVLCPSVELTVLLFTKALARWGS